MNFETELTSLLEAYFPEIGEGPVRKLLLFYREVLKWNTGINLVSRKEPGRTVIRLILDSLFLLKVLEGNERALDIGSGAGFPGVPLLIVSGMSMVLAEARRKRAAFLNHVIHLLNLDQGRVVNESICVDSVGRLGLFGAVWAKAALPIQSLFSIGQMCLQPGGSLILFHPFRDKKERRRVEGLAEAYGFLPPVFNVYSCPDLYLTRTLTVCRKAEEGRITGVEGDEI